MASQKIITVFGAIGKQGGSIVRTFLNDPRLKDAWAVRGVSRSVEGDGGKKPSAQGVEVVAASLDGAWDSAGQETCRRCKPWKEAGVSHYIWSSLLNVNICKSCALPGPYAPTP